MIANKHFFNAKNARQDEFYTKSSDIKEELIHYSDKFKDKVIYCNCDDPAVSNFYKYFYNNYKELGIKKIIASCYKDKSAFNFITPNTQRAVAIIYEGKNTKIQQLRGDGDFRKKESIYLLQQADIVVSNPPFSLFREYIDQLMFYKKEFLVLGPQIAVTYKNIFYLLCNQKMWMGCNNKKEKLFFVPDTYSAAKTFRTTNVAWYTNIFCKAQYKHITLEKTYTQKNYPKYDNYDAINVNKIKDIPMDYNGLMGVPITFFKYYNPQQFRLVEQMLPLINRKKIFRRIILQTRGAK